MNDQEKQRADTKGDQREFRVEAQDDGKHQPERDTRCQEGDHAVDNDPLDGRGIPVDAEKSQRQKI